MPHSFRSGLLSSLLLVLLTLQPLSAAEISAPRKAASTSQGADATGAQVILVLGDSLTEGYGNTKEQAFPALLEKRLNHSSRSAERHKFTVINGGVSGSTTASGLSRFKWYLKAHPSILILALGANDGLRGVSVQQTRKNLADVVELALKNRMKVLIAGMKMPPNYGKAYTREFEALFKDLSHSYQIPMIPFLLEGVAAHPDLNIEDGIHPNPKGHEIISRTVDRYLEPLL
ncbi:MAG: arylesterase [Methylotenera sp.]|nr:arylesterase [Oligoflexia bacterium]